MNANYCEEGCCGAKLREFECEHCEVYHGVLGTYYDEHDYKETITHNEVSSYFEN
jgi:hypothetical protein